MSGKMHNPAQLELPELHITIPVVRIPQADGSLLIRPGKPVVTGPEMSTREFARATGISQRHVETLCEEGRIKARKLTTKPGSQWRIEREELPRFLTATEQ